MTEMLRLRNDKVEWREVEDEVVALTTEDDRYLGANRTGAILWKSLAAGAELEALHALLVTEGATPEQAAADTDVFLSALRERGLLEG